MLKLDKEMLYREVILEHYKNPLNSGLVDGPKIFHSKNPVCGDDVKVQIELDEEKNIKNIFHKSVGCSISVSSVSVLTGVLKGKSLKQALYIANNFINMATGLDYDAEIDFKDGVVFENIKNYPARKACATVGWDLVKKAVEEMLKEENGGK
ncbi:MAG: Fe-S cluster assembly sulfur transfer protein SufU [Christensenellales bacterium]|jgi:nitrogen fixation NifU-like protein